MKAQKTGSDHATLLDAEQLNAAFAALGSQSGEALQTLLAKSLSGDDFSLPDKGVVARTLLELSAHLLAHPERLAQAQLEFTSDLLKLCAATKKRLEGETAAPVIEPETGDRRFQDKVWDDEPWFDFVKQYYLLAARSISDTVATAADGLDSKLAAKAEFYTRQYLNAMAPPNFAPLNPKVLRSVEETGGESLLKGLGNLLADLQRGNGELRVKMTDTEAFELGRNIAITPGKVVFQTPLMQLLQYSPSTETVFKRPLLIVPPWINKFYILDLKPENSFIRWAVAQGFTVFVVSWVNPDEVLAERDFEDYLLEGTLAALDAIEQATGEREINAIGYCLGGTLLMSTLAYLAASGREASARIKCATLLTTLVEFSEVGDLGVFVDDEQIGLIEQQMERHGYLEGSKMANVFNMLKPNDLIWSFWINNYLLGREPKAFDLLYWNADSTRMPKRMHSFYLRNMYLNNRLCRPGGIELAGEPIDLGKIKTPLYFLSTTDDHIAPWRGAYNGALLPAGSVRFVLGGSGHIAGVVNPAGSKKYGYRTSKSLASDAGSWMDESEQHEGSWWPDWLRWIKRRAGKRVAAREPGDGKLEVLEDAPGSYVKVRSDTGRGD